jgi:hypothetical protein
MSTKRKFLVATGALMIGDAFGYLLGPSRYLDTWRGKGRVRWYARLMEAFARHPAIGVCIALGEALAGAALVRRAEAR